MQNDECLVWARAAGGRKIVEVIEPIPTGFSVTTQWVEHDVIYRQDCKIVLLEGVSVEGQAKGFG